MRSHCLTCSIQTDSLEAAPWGHPACVVWLNAARFPWQQHMRMPVCPQPTGNTVTHVCLGLRFHLAPTGSPSLHLQSSLFLSLSLPCFISPFPLHPPFLPGFPVPPWAQDLGGSSLGVRHTWSSNRPDTHTQTSLWRRETRMGRRAEVLGGLGELKTQVCGRLKEWLRGGWPRATVLTKAAPSPQRAEALVSRGDHS